MEEVKDNDKDEKAEKEEGKMKKEWERKEKEQKKGMGRLKCNRIEMVYWFLNREECVRAARDWNANNQYVCNKKDYIMK